MKPTSAFLGITGSILVFIYAMALVFFRQEILPSAGGASKFDPDSFILLVAGLLGLFGFFLGIAGSALSFYSGSPKRRRTFWGRDPELSGIMLLGAAVSGAVMFAALSALFTLVYITRFNRYAVLATGIIAFILLLISGVISLTSRRESKEERDEE